MKNKRLVRIILYVIIGLVLLSVPFVSMALFTHYGLMNDATYDVVVSVSFGAAAFIMLIITVLEFVSPFIVKDASFDTAIVALCILIQLICSNDIRWVISKTNSQIPENIYSLINIFSFIAFCVATIFLCKNFVRTYKVVLDKRETIASIIIAILCVVAYIPLRMYNIGSIPVGLAVILSIYWIIKLTYYIIRFNKIDWSFILTIFIFICMLGALMSEVPMNSRVFNASNKGIVSGMMIIAALFFFGIYLTFTIQTTQEAYKKEEYEKRLNTLQANVLKNQIDPHFLFNSLNIIKNIYKEDKQQGDRAIDLLSKHLRAYTAASNTYLVPLEQELENVSAYTEIENLKISKSFNILYDIDFEEFEVPPFSIQVFIENAFKYSRVNEIEDGYIVIKAYQEDGFNVIEVIDNGVGFDVNQIKNTSYGIKNSKERFKLLLDAECKISSKKDEGTKVVIKIPIKKG